MCLLSFEKATAKCKVQTTQKPNYNMISTQIMFICMCKNNKNDSEYLYFKHIIILCKNSEIDNQQAFLHFLNALYCKTVVTVKILLFILQINVGSK